MAGFGLRKNMVFDWSGLKFRIDRLHDKGDVVLERLADGSMSVHKRQALLTEYREGKIAASIEFETGRTPKTKVFSRPLDELPISIQLEVKRRRHYLQAISSAGKTVFTMTHLEPLILRAAAEIGDPNPPSTTSVYRWHLRYRREQDSRALIPRIDRRGSHALKQSETILRLVSDSIGEAFKSSPMASGPSIYETARKDRNRESIPDS